MAAQKVTGETLRPHASPGVPPKLSVTENLVNRYKSNQASSSSNTNSTPSVIDESHESKSSWSLLKSLLVSSHHSAWSWLGGTTEDITEKELIANLLQKKKTAISYQAWLEASEKLDELQNLNSWKEQKQSTLYDYKLIERLLGDIKEARMAGDTRKLLYLIRTTWARNVGNIGNVNLYRHSHTGTKRLIEEYLRECHLALEDLTKEGPHDIDDRYTLSMLIQTRKNIGRTALLLSGGGAFGLFHIGVLAALLEEDVLPRIVSGSSGGAIVASILCIHNKEEAIKLVSTMVDEKFNVFDDCATKEGLIVCLTRFLKYGTWFDSENLKQTMKGLLGELTFREAFYRTGKILNITVSPASEHEHPRLLNYLTAPSVLIWSAVCASCSLPGVFASSTIYEKNPRTGATQEWHHHSVKFVDGSVDNDLPITRLSEMFNVDHIIACQVNPHVVPFLKFSLTCVGGEIETEYSARFKAKLSQAYEIWSAEVAHYLQMSAEVGISRNLCTKLRSIISQQYSGDITILPDYNDILRLDKMLKNPTPEFLLHYTIKGARATWPKLSIIRNHCSLEFALDHAINLLKGRNFKDMNPTLALVNPSSNIPRDDATSNSRHNNSIKGDNRPTMVDKNHHRHRSETISIARMKSLRPVKSNISVQNAPETAYASTPRSTFKPSSPLSVARYHRSYSASNQETGSFFLHQTFAPPSAELKRHGSSTDTYVPPALARKNSRSSMLSRRNTGISSTSSSSDKLFLKVEQKRESRGNEPLNNKYQNVDYFDGLFDSQPIQTSSGSGSDSSVDTAIDPQKVDDFSDSENTERMGDDEGGALMYTK